MNERRIMIGVAGRAAPLLGLIAAFVAISLFSAGRSLTGSAAGENVAALPACERDEALFPDNVDIPEGLTIVEGWAKLYHDRVRKIVDDSLGRSEENAVCDGRSHVAASESLKSLALDLGETDAVPDGMPALLIQYLERYECALVEESLIAELRAEESASQQPVNAEDQDYAVTDLQAASQRERRAIAVELLTARPAMHRTLTYLSGRGRFDSLNGALQCLMGATLDIRNALDLAAEASACMPRIWDARTSLRTLPSK